MDTISVRSRDSSVSIVTRLRAGRSGFYPRQGLRICLFAAMYRPILGPTQPSIQWVPEVLSLEIKRPDVKLTLYLHLALRLWMLGAIPPLPNTSSWR